MAIRLHQALTAALIKIRMLLLSGVGKDDKRLYHFENKISMNEIEYDTFIVELLFTMRP